MGIFFKNKKAFIIKSAVTGLSAAAILVPFAANAQNTFAATGGKTATQAINWVKSNVGRGIDYDGYYGNQCVDLAKAYYAYLNQGAVSGNGADYAYNYTPDGWNRIKGETNPIKGDILVYTGGYGGYGHVAIYESDYSHYHQNWNGHPYVERVTYKYNFRPGISYWGVIRPDFKSETVHSGFATRNDPAVKTTSSSGFTGVKIINGTWTYVKKGKADYSFTGVAKTTNGNWVFVKNGRFNNSFTGVAKTMNGNWVYVNKGRFDDNFKGVTLVVNSGKKYYMVKGRWSKTFTGKYKSYTIKNGVVI